MYLLMYFLFVSKYPTASGSEIFCTCVSSFRILKWSVTSTFVLCHSHVNTFSESASYKFLWTCAVPFILVIHRLSRFSHNMLFSYPHFSAWNFLIAIFTIICIQYVDHPSQDLNIVCVVSEWSTTKSMLRPLVTAT